MASIYTAIALCFMCRPGSESIQVDSSRLEAPKSSRVDFTRLNYTGFVDLSRFCFMSTWKRLTVLLLLSSILSVKQQQIG